VMAVVTPARPPPITTTRLQGAVQRHEQEPGGGCGVDQISGVKGRLQGLPGMGSCTAAGGRGVAAPL
jgi:hypothetical protein